MRISKTYSLNLNGVLQHLAVVPGLELGGKVVPVGGIPASAHQTEQPTHLCLVPIAYNLLTKSENICIFRYKFHFNIFSRDSAVLKIWLMLIVEQQNVNKRKVKVITNA